MTNSNEIVVNNIIVIYDEIDRIIKKNDDI